MAKKSALGLNPLNAASALDAMIPEQPQEKPAPVDAKGSLRCQAQQQKMQKERFTVNMPIGVINDARNAVYWTPGLTLAGLAEEALKIHLAKLAEARGEEFPQRTAELAGGRPVSL